MDENMTDTAIQDQSTDVSTETTQDVSVSQENADQNVEQVAQGTPQESVWDGKQFALKFRGKEIIPESKDKLINLAQLGHTYSTKLNDLQSRESALAEQMKAVEELNSMRTAFEKNPAFKQQILNLYYQSQGQGNQEVTEGQQEANVPPELVKTVNELSQWRQTYETQRADEDLRSEISDIVQKNPDFDWKTADENGQTMIHDVLKKAQELGGVPLSVAFKEVAWEQMQEMAKANALKAYNDQKAAVANKGKAVSPQKSTSAPKQNQPDARSMSYDEIAKNVIANLNK
jgi:hypothetical protein